MCVFWQTGASRTQLSTLLAAAARSVRQDLTEGDDAHNRKKTLREAPWPSEDRPAACSVSKSLASWSAACLQWPPGACSAGPTPTPIQTSRRCGWPSSQGDGCGCGMCQSTSLNMFCCQRTQVFKGHLGVGALVSMDVSSLGLMAPLPRRCHALHSIRRSRW